MFNLTHNAVTIAVKKDKPKDIVQSLGWIIKSYFFPCSINPKFDLVVKYC